MESRVWIGTKGRYDPRQRFEEAILSFDGDTLTFRGDGMPVSLNLSEVRFDFPRSMSKAGFLMTQRGIKAYIWFYDPFAGRKTLISSGDKDEAVRDGVHSCFVGRRVAKPWLKALRARTR
ncbi:MAG TPA: hypothetical protein VNH45_02240 [Gaiellaceae bacterium]|jgi:hypothetical protein|nr:hypothetical protein [Gaiellaceae bacterium]